MKKGDHVKYMANYGYISAVVRRVHRDDTATIEARFSLGPDGETLVGYHGDKFRISQGKLEPYSGSDPKLER